MNRPNSEEQTQINDKVTTYLTQGRIDAAIAQACSGASPDTIDLLVHTILQNEQLWSGRKEVPHQALKAAELGASQKAFDALIQVCAAKGWVDGAYKAAKMRGVPLSQGEADAIVKGCVDQAEPAAALRAAAFGASPEAVDSLVGACAHKGSGEWLKIATEAVRRFGASSSVIDSLILSIAKGSYTGRLAYSGDDLLDLAVRGSSQAAAVLLEAIIKEPYGGG